MATVLISGGTGLIGTALTRELTAKGYDVIVLARHISKDEKSRKQPVRLAQWSVEKQTIDSHAIKQADYLIHMAGASVASRWTDKHKKAIVDSRVKSGELLVKALKEIPNNIKAVVSASAIGWYGADPVVPNPTPFVETHPAAADTFLGHTCLQWEASTDPIAQMGKRLVKLRTGIVLSKEGGAYPEFKKTLKFGVNSILGSGKQVLSWIHILDIVGLYIKAIEDESWNGVYNAVAPMPVSNEQLMRLIAKENGRFSLPVHVPELALKLALGEMSIEVLKSATVSSRKVQEAGYQFMFPSIEAAVKNLERKTAK